MTGSPSAKGIRLILSAFHDSGWQDAGNTALGIMESVIEDQRVLDSVVDLARHVPDEFLLVNSVSATEVYAAVGDIAGALRQLGFDAVALNVPPLVQISDIDSFSKVQNIPAADVAGFANPLKLAEDVVERIIAKIIGEPYLVYEELIMFTLPLK